jgi:hypothetical protein
MKGVDTQEKEKGVVVMVVMVGMFDELPNGVRETTGS